MTYLHAERADTSLISGRLLGETQPGRAEIGRERRPGRPLNKTLASPVAYHVRFLKQLFPAVLAIFVQSCAAHSPKVSVPSPAAEGCPFVLLTRTGGLGYESQSGVVAAVWQSGTIVRAESAEHPWRTHIVGRLEKADVAELLDLVNSSTIWNQPSGEVALDMADDVLSLRRGGELREWSETPGITSTPVIAQFRAKLVALSIEQPARARQPLEDLWSCLR